MIELNQIYNMDCIEGMKLIDDKSVDMIFVDLPYGVTAQNKWDTVIPFEPLWEQFERIIKDNGAILLFGQDKFTAKCMLSNEKLHRYNIIWKKTTPTGFLNANRMPLRTHEDIMVFYKSLPTYNPQKTTGHKRKVSTAEHKRASTVTNDYGKHGLTTYDSTEPVLLSQKGSKFEKKIEFANTLLARDYKGFGNQAMNGVITNGKKK